MSNNIERRFHSQPVNLEQREGEEPKISGVASVFNQRTNLFWFEEEIAPGAFDNADMSDVRGLFNHDSNMILGRTKSGTLKLDRTADGLLYTIDPPDTQVARDLMTSMKRGDVDQSSFAFTVKEQVWTERKGELDLRTITEVEKVYDVSPVTYPAYDGTSSEARSLMNIDTVLEGMPKNLKQRCMSLIDADWFLLNRNR